MKEFSLCTNDILVFTQTFAKCSVHKSKKYIPKTIVIFKLFFRLYKAMARQTPNF